MSVNTLERDVARLLHEGQDAARRGDRAMARALLTQLVEQDPRNEEAWMWLSGVVTDPDEQQICLENALVINPYNAHARKGLEFVLTKTNTPARVPLTPPAPGAAALATPTPPPAPAQTPMPAPAPFTPPMQSAPAWATPAPVVPAAPAQPPPVTYPAMVEAIQVTEFGPEVMAANNSDHTSPINASMVDRNRDAFRLGDDEVPADFDAEPFIPPGMDEFDAAPANSFHTPTGTLLNSTPDQIGEELPSWLQDLTPSAPSHHEEDTSYSHFSMSDFPSQQSNGASMQNTNGMQGMNANSAPAMSSTPFHPTDFPGDFPGRGDIGMGAPSAPSAPAPMPAPMPGPAGPFGEVQMPSPHELPGGTEGYSAPKGGPAQPWYLQGGGSAPQGNGSAYLDSTMLKSTSLHSTMLTSSLTEEQRRNKPVTMIPCPNCQTQVNDTSLACPNCRYSFFANCPYCHELLDTSEATHSADEPCPYCGKSVNKRALGLGGAPDLVSQKNPGSRPGDSGPAPDPAYPAMKQTLIINTQDKRGLSLGWVVDLLWLVAIVAMVWALTQLPNWLHLSGLY